MASYTRNPESVKKHLTENSAGQIQCAVACTIQVPERFIDVELGQVGANTFIYGLFPIIIGNEYTVCNVCGLVEIDPFKITKIKVNDVSYYEFGFEAGQVIVKTTTIVRRNTLPYNVINEIVFQGKVPWYVTYDDLGKLFDTASEFANSAVGDTAETIEFMASVITRSKTDRSKLIRNVASSYKDTEVGNITYVPLSNVFYSVSSTMNKLAGSYFSDGLTSSLVKKTDKINNIEAILRA
jgi:hypothetical protein